MSLQAFDVLHAANLSALLKDDVPTHCHVGVSVSTTLPPCLACTPVLLYCGPLVLLSPNVPHCLAGRAGDGNISRHSHSRLGGSDTC